MQKLTLIIEKTECPHTTTTLQLPLLVLHKQYTEIFSIQIQSNHLIPPPKVYSLASKKINFLNTKKICKNINKNCLILSHD